jgi:hypothetical protein
MALFPDMNPKISAGDEPVLHVFSGSLRAGNYLRCDRLQQAELQCRAEDLPTVAPHPFDLIIADPPYSIADAEKYSTPMINRPQVLKALAAVTNVGGHLCWLDTQWPIHSKTQWLTVGRILVQRSTNHRVRVLSLFERVA